MDEYGGKMELISEFCAYMKRSFFICAFMVFSIVTAIVLFNFSSLMLHEAQLDFDKYEEVYDEGKYYGIGDNFFDEAGEALRNMDNYVDLLVDFNNWLLNNGRFKYLEGREEFISYIDNKGENHRSTESYWTSPNDITHFGLNVCKGRMLEQQDFIHTKGMANDTGLRSDDELPIVLGYGFIDKYDLGDTIEVYHNLFAGKARIVGFLNQGSTVFSIYTQGVISLDNYFVFPFFNQFSGNESTKYMRILYYQKNFCRVYSRYSTDDTQDMINEYTSLLGIPGGYIVFASNHQWQPVFAKNLDETVTGIKGVAIGISLFSALSLGLYLFVKIRKSLKYYGILLLNGFSSRQIMKLIFGEVIVVMITSFGIGLLISYIIKNNSYQEYDINMLTGIVPMLAIGLVGAIVALIVVNRYDISTSIREESL